jgi:hypothetical protein
MSDRLSADERGLYDDFANAGDGPIEDEVDTHPFGSVGGCMSRCWCGRSFSDPIHGEQPENIKRLRRAAEGTDR